MEPIKQKISSLKPPTPLRKRIKAASTCLIPILLTALFFLTPIGPSLAQGALSWTRPVDITRPSNSTNALFGAIVCDQYQNTHILWADRAGESAEIYYRNDVLGDWSIPVDVLAFPYPVAIRLAAAVSNTDDILHLLWVSQWIRGDLYYSNVPIQEASDPRAWSTPVVLATATEAGYIAIDSQGVLHVVYEATDSSGFEVGIDYIYSEDSGSTWSNSLPLLVKRAPVPSSATARIAVDGAGRVHVGVAIRSQEYGVYSEVGYIRSTDRGQTWENYKLIDDSSSTFQGLAMIAPYAFGDDEVHLTWHEPRRMHQWSLDGGETWSEPVEVMSLGGAFGGANGLVKDSAGVVHYVTTVRGGVFSASWTGSGWGDREQIDDRPNDPHGQAIEVCQGNKLQVIFDDRNDTQKVWYSSAVADAPHIDREPLPTPQPQPVDQAPSATQPVSEGGAAQESSQPVGLVSLEDGESAPRPEPMRPIVLSVVPVLLLIVVVFTVYRRR